MDKIAMTALKTIDRNMVLIPVHRKDHFNTSNNTWPTAKGTLSSFFSEAKIVAASTTNVSS
jgi:hypothetical protein